MLKGMDFTRLFIIVKILVSIKRTRRKGKYKKRLGNYAIQHIFIDRYVYSYYGFLINQKYNKYVSEKQIDTVAVAYRDNLRKNKIHFAKGHLTLLKIQSNVM